MKGNTLLVVRKPIPARLFAAVLVITMLTLLFLPPKKAEAQQTCNAGTFYVGLIKYGTQATDTEIQNIMEALRVQMNDQFASDWNRCVSLYYAPSSASYIAGSWPVYLTQQAFCNGSKKHHDLSCDYTSFHDVNTSTNPVLPYAWITDTGAGYTPRNLDEYSANISHEVIEMAGNPYYNSSITTWGGAIGWNQNIDFETELADPVEQTYQGYRVTNPYNGVSYEMSDYVLPQWFVYGSTPGRGEHIWDATGKYTGVDQVPGATMLASTAADGLWYFYPYNNGMYAGNPDYCYGLC